MFSKIGDSRYWTLMAALDEAAERTPDRIWLADADGQSLSFARAQGHGLRAAGFFARLGIEPEERVGLMLFNGCDFATAWLGLGYRAAVAVFLNTELRGHFLSHQLQDAQLHTLVVDAELLPALAEVAAEAPLLRTVVVVGTHPADCEVPAHWTIIDWPDWDREPDWSGPAPRAQDIAGVMYTSGTSGPAKGVLMPHAHCTLYGIGAIKCTHLSADDRYYIPLPFFHANGLFMQLGATLLTGCFAYTRRRFSASHWLSDVRAQRITATNQLGATSAFVLAQPASEHDRDHSLRITMNAPNLPEHEQIFRDRFGIRDVVSGYGMTENNIPIWGRAGHPAPGAAGWVHTEHFDVRIADADTDQPVAPGEMGEILVRPKVPFGFMAGYLNAPDKTVEAWRNLWFHTGDAGIMDADGLVTFVDRIRDCIRRRGHNISSTEIESAVATLPEVAEVAAYPIASDVPGGEDEVMLAVVLKADAPTDLSELGERAINVLPRFARPRYLRQVDELPKTATGKVRRAVLQQQGTASAVDLEASTG